MISKVKIRWFAPLLLLAALAGSGCNRKSLLDKVSLTIEPGHNESVSFRTKSPGGGKYTFHAELDLVHVSGPAVHVLLLTKDEYNRFEDGATAQKITESIVKEAMTRRVGGPPTSTTWLDVRKSFKTSQYIGREGGSQHYLVVANPGSLGGPAARVVVSVDIRRDREK